MLAVLLLVAAATVWPGGDGEEGRAVPGPALPGPPPAGTRAATAAALLAGVEAYLRGAGGGSGGDDGHARPEGLVAGGDRPAHDELTAAAANARSLRLGDLRLRYLGDSTVRPQAAERARLGPTAWVGEVEVGWRLVGVDRSRSTATVPMVLDHVGTRAVFRTARLAESPRVPLWLLARLAVHRGPAGVVATADPARLGTLVTLHRRAVAAVGLAVPGWRGRLVVEAPGTVPDLLRSSGTEVASPGSPRPRSPARAERVAALTTTADGTRAPESALRVHLDPEVFWGLGPRARGIVLTHEAAHVALGSVLTPVPLWLSEGLADHVALRDAGVPVADSAAGISTLVRSDGLPRSLPRRAELTGPDGGAWYEAAWLAVRVLAERYGEGALLELHDTVAGDDDLAGGLRTVLGITEAELVRAWRAELAALAGRPGPSAVVAG